jgi:hypothetical protein
LFCERVGVQNSHADYDARIWQRYRVLWINVVTTDSVVLPRSTLQASGMPLEPDQFVSRRPTVESSLRVAPEEWSNVDDMSCPIG